MALGSDYNWGRWTMGETTAATKGVDDGGRRLAATMAATVDVGGWR
jgi:hypothetical protein